MCKMNRKVWPQPLHFSPKAVTVNSVLCVLPETLSSAFMSIYVHFHFNIYTRPVALLQVCCFFLVIIFPDVLFT